MGSRAIGFRVLLAAALAVLLLAAPAVADADKAIVLYNRTTDQYVWYRTLDLNTGWMGTEANFALGSDPATWRVDWSRAVASPGRSNVLIGLQKSAPAATTAVPTTGNLSVFIWNSSTNATSDFLYLASGTGGSLISGRPRRVFDVAFESRSGRGLVVYNATNLSEPDVTGLEYRIWTPGSGWGAQLLAPDIAGAGRILRWVGAASNPAKDEILAVTSDNSVDLFAFLWNGTGWTNFSANPLHLNTMNWNAVGNKTFDVAFDSYGEKALIVYSQSSPANSTIRYRIYYSANQTLSAELTGPTLPNTGNIANQFRLAPDPASNRMVLGVIGSLPSPLTNDDAYFALWDGEKWTALNNAATLLASSATSGADGRRHFDVAFDGRSQALGLMSVNNQTTYFETRNHPGNDSWSSNASIPTPGTFAEADGWVLAAGSPNASDGSVLLVTRDAGGDTNGIRWDPGSQSWKDGLVISNASASRAWSGEPEAIAWSIGPQPVVELHPTSSGSDYINWSWRNPAWGFNSSQVFLDGVSVAWTGAPGSISYYNATGLGAGTAHTLTVRATDLSGGAAVNVSSTGFTATSGTLLLYDDFEAGGGSWTTSGGTWKNVTGTLQANVSNTAGTALRGDGSWTEYEVTFSSKTLQKGNEPWHTARFLFRYSNASNYFALIPHYNTTALEIAQMYGGVWYGNRCTGYFEKFGQDWHTYTIRVTNNTSNATRVDINISVDGVLYMRCTESAQPIANGSVGLYLDAGGGSSSLAQWDDVRVALLPRPSFSNASWNQSSVSPNTPVRFNVTIESTDTVTEARINVTYPNGTTLQRSLANTSLRVGPNRYNWSYNETSTSAAGTYTAVNVSALNAGGWNTSALSGVSFTVAPPGSNFLPGDTVQVHDTGATLNVRGPNACDSVVATKSDGANGTVTADPPVVCNFGGTDYTMWRVVWEDGVVGWSAENWLRGKVRGIDVSHFQGTINWTRVFDSGIRFAFAKATEGATFNDSRFEENMKNGTAAGLSMGAYHFARPDNNDPETEANHFLDIAGPYLTRGRLRPVLDMETVGNVGAGSMSEWVNRWMNTVKNATGLEPLIYSSPSFANSNYVSNVSQWELWVAAWPACKCPDDSPSSTSWWSDWAVWQYSDTGSVPGISGNVDLDVLNGGLSRLQNYVNRSPFLSGASWNLSSASAGQPVRFNATVTGQGNVSEARLNVTYPNSSTAQRSLSRGRTANDSWFSGSGPDFQEGARYVIRNSTDSGGPTYFYFNTSTGNFTLTNISPLIYTGAGTGTPAGNDGCTQAPVPLGFPFKFFGAAYTAVHVCNDGYLSFINIINSTGVFTNAAIPNGASPNGFIAPFWDDLCSGTGGGGIFNATIGAPPDRIFVVRWELASWSGSGCASETDKYNFMAVLYENSSDIQFNYADTTSNPSGRDDCASATVGIENQSGDSGIQHSFNSALCSAGRAVRFYYPNRYTYVETSTSAGGTYAAVNVSARNEFNVWNTSALSGVTFTVVSGDTTPPVITSIASSIFDNSNTLKAHVTFDTDEPARLKIKFGKDPDLVAARNNTNYTDALTGVKFNTSYRSNTSLEDIDYGALYYYHPMARDGAGNENSSTVNVRTFTSNACTGSTTGSTLTLNFPVLNSTDGYARLGNPDRGFARSLNINVSKLDDTRSDTNPILVDPTYGRRMFYPVVGGAGGNPVYGWDTSYTQCNRAVVLVEANNTITTNGANYTANTHRNLSVADPMLLEPALLEKIPDLAAVAGPSTGSDGYVNLTFTSQKDPNRGVVNYSLYRSTDNATYTRIANITAVPNTTLSYNDTGLSFGDKYYRLKVMTFGGFESEGFGNITRAYVPDSSPPSGTSITYASGYNTTGSISISFSNGSDTESGVSGNNLTSQQAALTSGSCGAFSPVAPWTINLSNAASPQTLSVTQGRCFRFAINVTNGEGYWSNVSGGTVMVDTTAPTGGSISYFDGINDTKTVVITLTNASDPESGVGTNFLDIRETAYNNGTDTCNPFGSNWTNLTSGIASGYTVTGLETQKCYSFKMRTRNGAGTNSSDITSPSVVKVVGITVTVTSPSAGEVRNYAEVPVNVTTSQPIATIQARIGSDPWINLTPQCAGGTTCNTTFLLHRNGAYTLDLFANSTLDPVGQSIRRAFTLSVPGTPTVAVQETARELASGAMALSSGGLLKWKRTMNDSTVWTTSAEGGAGILLALAEAYEAVGGPATLDAVNQSSNWLVATNSRRTGTTGRWWMLSEEAGATAVRSDLPGGSLGPVDALLRAYELTRNGSYFNAAKEGLSWLLNNTSVAYNESPSAYTTGNANLSFCISPASTACGPQDRRATSMTGAAGAIEVLLRAYNASGNGTYLNAAKSVANWLTSQAAAPAPSQSKWPRVMPPPPGGAEYFTGFQEGTAGVVQALLDLYFATHDTAYLEWAVRGGNWLAARQTSDGAWLIIDQGSACSTSSSPGTPCLTGYDYGAAGILDVLLQLYNATRSVYGGDSNSTVASFRRTALGAANWLIETGSGKAADDVDGSGSIDGTGELRWRYEPATDRFYTGDSGETGGAASIVRALANAYGVLGSNSYRLAAEEGIRRLKNPQTCFSSDGDFVSNGSGSLRCRDRDSDGEFTSGRNGTAGVLGAMSRIERLVKVAITVPDASTRGYPSSTQANIPVLVKFNVSRLLSDVPVTGLQPGDVRVYHDGVLVTPIHFTGNATGGDYSLNISASPAKGDHTLFVRVRSGALEAASPAATYTVGSTHSASTSTNRSRVAPGEQFAYNVTVTGTAEVPAQVWVNTTVPSDVTLISPASPNQSVNVSSGSAQVSYVFQAVTNVNHQLSSTVTNGTGQNATTVTVGATVSGVDGPSITTISNSATGDSSTSVTIAPNTSVLFSAAADQTGTWTWKVDGAFVQSNSSVSSATYQRNFASSGTYSVTVNVSNVNGTSATTTWTVTAVGTPNITAITNNATSDSSTDISVTAGTTVRFQATGNQSGNWTWRANGTVVKWQVGGSTSTHDTLYSSTGSFNMSVNLSNANGTGATKVWNITVNPPPPPTPSLAIEATQVNKSTSSDCPATPCVGAIGEDFNLSVRVKNNGAAVAPGVYVNRTLLSAITWLASSGTRPVRQTTLLPDAAGDLSQWGVTGTAPNYAAVDDGASDSDTTYVNTTTQNNRDLYNLGDLPADAATVLNVTVIVQARKADVNPVNFNINVRTGGGFNWFSSDIALADTYANYTIVLETNPETGSAWTVPEVNALQAGVQHRQPEVREARVTAVWVRVNYTESDSIFLGDLSPGEAVWANWTLEFNSGPNQSYALAVTARDNLTTLSNSTSICLILCSPVTLALTPSTNRTGDSVGLNGYINVTVAVKNNHDTRTVTNVNVSIHPPAGLVFTANDSGGSGNWSIISSLAPGASASRNFTLRAGAYGAYSVPLQAVSPTIGSDTFSASQSVTVSGPTLFATVSANRSAVTSGQPFTVTVTVTNNGATAATGVTSNLVLDTCPSGATLPPDINRSLGSLAVGASNSTNYTVSLNTGGSTCTFKGYGNNSTQVGSGDTSSGTTSPVSSTVLSLTSAVSNLSTVATGQVFRVDVTVTNSNDCTGCAGTTLTGVWTNLSLPAGVRMHNGSNTSNVGTLAAGGSNVSTFFLVADAAGTHSIRASTTSANGGSPSASSVSVTAETATLTVSAAFPEQVAVGTVFNYTLVLASTGLGNVNNLTYNVTLPPGVEYAGGDAMNGTVGTLTQGQNISYNVRLNVTGGASTYTIRGYGNASNTNASTSSRVTAVNIAAGWSVTNLPSSVTAGTPVQLSIRVMNGADPVNGARVNVTEYNGVGLFAAPTQGKSTRVTVSGTTDANGYANLTVIPAPSTFAGYSLRVTAAGANNQTPESNMTVVTTPTPRGSSPLFSGEDYWSLFTSLPGEIAAAVSKISYLTGTVASSPAYSGSQAIVTLSGVPTVVNATPSTVDNRVPTTVAVRTTQGGKPKANLTVRLVETSGHSLFAGANQSNWTSEISGVTDVNGYANLSITPTRSSWSDWLQAKGSAPFNISLYVSDGSTEQFVMGITVASGTPSSAYLQDSSSLAGALATEIDLLKNKVGWIVP